MKRFILISSILLLCLGAGVFWVVDREVSSYADALPERVLPIYTADGVLLQYYEGESRIHVPFSVIPKTLVKAFLVSQDKDFYAHQGITASKLFEKEEATITRKVARLLLNSGTITGVDVVKESVLALRLERTFSKEHLFETYLNHVYVGNELYGVASAARHYFNKSIEDISLEESALLATLAQAPQDASTLMASPNIRMQRNQLIASMAQWGGISTHDASRAMATLIESVPSSTLFALRATPIANVIQQQLHEQGKSLPSEAVYSTIKSSLQQMAEKTIASTILSYEKRNGYSGVLGSIETKDWLKHLRHYPKPEESDGQLAVILEKQYDNFLIGLPSGRRSYITFDTLQWAVSEENSLDTLLRRGDVVLVEKQAKVPGDGSPYILRQLSTIQASLVAMDPQTGKILALASHGDIAEKQYALGSLFDPFIYLASLEKGFTPASVVEGSTSYIEEDLLESASLFRSVTLREGLAHSDDRAVHVLKDSIAQEKLSEIKGSFGISETETMDALSLTSAFSMVANGGKFITPWIIGDLPLDTALSSKEGERVIDEKSAYQLVSMLEDIAPTDAAIPVVDIANKMLVGVSGLAQENTHVWSVGIARNLVVSVLLHDETMIEEPDFAESVISSFMDQALPQHRRGIFSMPTGLRMVEIDKRTGFLPTDNTPERDIIVEIFKKGTEPYEAVDRYQYEPSIHLSLYH